MFKPHFFAVHAKYPSNKKVKKSELFKDIGWDDLIDNPAYDNTCAIRVSLALIKSGVHVQGRMKIKSGDHKGQLIEPGQQKLSTMLATNAFFGTPEKFSPSEAPTKIGHRQGIISFMQVPGYNGGRGGHIDLVSIADGGYYICASDCYWNANQIWFWDLR